MKKILLTTMGVAALGMASYAATFMQVKTNDGKIVKFDVEDVTEVDFMTEEIIPQDTTPIFNHSYVDLGLPSGTLWATYNIGATKPEEYGDYFAWGETEPKEVYNWSTYKYSTSKYTSWDEYVLDSIMKYNMSGLYGKIDNLSTLLSEDDAATANWGSEWRMPTNDEQGELIKNSYMVWTNGYNGTYVRGVIFYKAKEDSDKGTYIPYYETPSADYRESSDAHVFFPAAGVREGSGVYDEGYGGNYWSSSLSEEVESLARYLSFDEESAYWNDGDGRSLGFPVRAVRAK